METPSLTARASKTSKEKKEETQLEEKAESFDKDQLQAAWIHFKEMRIENGSNEMEKIILGRNLQVKKDADLVITLRSSLEVSLFEKIEVELVGYLRKTLQNAHVSIAKEVEEEEQKEKLYTNSDKYDYLIKVNPKLKEMKDRLGLDFEF